MHPERGEPGYTGDLQQALGKVFTGGIDALASNGVIGDPARASTEHGARYWDEITALVLDAVGRP